MDSLLTKHEIEIRERCGAATPGPWGWSGQRVSRGAEPGELPYVPQCAYLGETLITLADTYENSREDCAFVAHAREDVPYLLGEVERLRRMLVDVAKASPEIAEGIMASLAPLTGLGAP